MVRAMTTTGRDLRQMSTTSVQVDSAIVTWALGALGAIVFFLVSILLRVGYRDMRERIDEVVMLKDEVVELRIQLSRFQSSHEKEIALLNAEIIKLESRIYALQKN
jgi:hypothetical protein